MKDKVIGHVEFQLYADDLPLPKLCTMYYLQLAKFLAQTFCTVIHWF